MWTSIALKILRYRAVFVWLIVAATFFMIQQSKKVEMSHSMARLLPENSTTQLDFNYFLDRFGINDNLMAIGIQDSNFFKIKNFNLWREVSDKIKNLEGVENVISINDVINLQKDDVSKITLSPASSCVFCEDIFPESNNNTFVNPVSLSSCIPSDDSTLVTESFALSINV